MSQPRSSRQDPGLFQAVRNPPPPSKPPSAAGTMGMYNPNQYNPGYPPANGSWTPRQQLGQQQPPVQPIRTDSWNWDENVNNFPSYSEANPTTATDSIPQNNLPSAFAAPSYSMNQPPVPSYQPDNAVNNNQYDAQPLGANQNWGWNDTEDWGWNADYQNPPNTQQASQAPPQTGPTENQPINFQGISEPPGVQASGLETGFSSLSLTGADQAQPQPPIQFYSEETNSLAWSRVPTWGSALDHEQPSLDPGSELSYPRELGERNTFADGASFTDPSQASTSTSVSNGPTNTPSVVSSNVLEQPTEAVHSSGRSMSTPVGASETRASPSPHTGTQVDHLHEPNVESGGIVEPGMMPYLPMSSSPSVPRMNSGPPSSYGDGFSNGSAPTSIPFNSSDSTGGVPLAAVPLVSDLPMSHRLPGSGSRSQSGTPSMERESERPDAEGGYENDQPTPLFVQPAPVSYVGTMADRKVAQESPAGSRPSSRQAGSTPSSEPPSTIPSPYHLPGEVNPFARPKPVSGASHFYPTPATTTHAPSVPSQSTAPTVARGSQEAVGSEFGPPLSVAPLSRADGMTVSSSVLPPSSQRMIPGSGSQGPPLLSMAPMQQQLQPSPQTRPSGTITPVSEQRIVTGFAKNDPMPPPLAGPSAPIAPLVVAASQQGPPSLSLQQNEEMRGQPLNRSPPPPHRSETIGSENPRANVNTGVAPVSGPVGGNGPADRSDDRISNDRDRDREVRPHDRGSRVDRDRDRDDYERDGRNRYPDDDEDERFSTSYRERDRRYEGDRDREHRDTRRYDDRDRGYSRAEYDDDRRSGYGTADRDRQRDPRRRESRRSDYYLTDAEMYERSGGRRSSLYEGDNNDPPGEFNRSAYGFNTSRDGRRRDNDRSRIDDRYYTRERPGADATERAISERDYRHGSSAVPGGRRRDPRDYYYQDPRYYGYSREAAYDPYRTAGYSAAAHAAYMQQYSQQLSYYYEHNRPYFNELRLKNPAAYSEWYQRYYGQRYTPTVVTGTGTGVGSMATSDADRASVHSGRSSVNEDHPSMLANHSISQQLRGSTTGLDQSLAYDYSLYQDEHLVPTSNQPVQDMTPHKFTCAHMVARFSPGGILLRVLPNSPKDGVAAHLELHDLNVLLGDLPTALEMKFFPGPLVPGQTHKQQVTVFCQQKIRRATEDSHQLVDRQSYILLWELLLLLLRQNGTIVGTDIAELLLKDHEILLEPVVQALPEMSDTGAAAVVAADRTLVSRQTEASVTKKFRELLLFGNKKEALEWAMTQGLWGHALFLASKMDQRTYSSVMIRFANGLALTDPLQTLYQLMSGKQPTAVTSCGDDKWGDWRPHLAMILSNSSTKSSSSDLDKKSIVTLGDTLSARGFLLAAHFCYLVAQVEFGSYSNKASKLVLLSSSSCLAFDAFATNEAIQCTEVYEYARQLAAPEFTLPSFQAYKFLYATRLAEHGRVVEALQYCEAVGNVMARCPASYPSTLIDQVYQLASMLKYNDPQYLTENDGALFTDPAWLTGLEEAVRTAAAAQSEYQPMVEQQQHVFEQTTEAESMPPTSTDYSSYPNLQQPQQGQQQQQQQQYGDQQSPLNQQQQSYYDPNSGLQLNYEENQQQSQQHQQHQQQQGSIEPESLPYSANNLQPDYNNSYGSTQYNTNYNWQQQPNQQTQQPWNNGEVSTGNGVGYTDYWNPQNNNLKDTNRHLASRCIPPEESKETEPSEGEEDLTEGAETGAVETADLTSSSSSSKRVVFGGTFPIDRPMSLNFAAVGSVRKRQQPMSLTVKTPRTFSIDEPIREDQSAENTTPADEVAGATGSFYEASYNPSPSPSMAATETRHTEDTKPGNKQESSNNSKAAAARAQQAGSGGGSWLGGFFNKFKPKTQMKLPDDKNPTIVWDPKKNQWVDTSKDGEDESNTLAPPPKDASFQSLPPVPLTPAFASPAPVSFTANNTAAADAAITTNNNNGGNRFGLNKGRGGRGGRNYVNPSNVQITSVNSPLPLLDPYPAATPLPSVPQFFVPSPAPIDGSAPSDFVSSPTPDASSNAQAPDAANDERFMYNPTQLVPPRPSTGRPGLASRGRYPAK